RSLLILIEELAMSLNGSIVPYLKSRVQSKRRAERTSNFLTYLAVVALFLGPMYLPGAGAQVSDSMKGTVTEASGAPIPTVTVTVQSLETGNRLVRNSRSYHEHIDTIASGAIRTETALVTTSRPSPMAVCDRVFRRHADLRPRSRRDWLASFTTTRTARPPGVVR